MDINAAVDYQATSKMVPIQGNFTHFKEQDRASGRVLLHGRWSAHASFAYLAISLHVQFVCLFVVGTSTDKIVYLTRSYAKGKKKKRRK